ncbi:hypothetical protein T484DRAFT_2027454 [Baffinella frigidus]|nr:hypothetical protein T484DRAFT_2027454 [Cryptophyta sp. CCMP2293]
MSITVHGMGFGVALHTIAMRQGGWGGGTACEWTEWESETRLYCMTTPGVRGTREVVITSGERVGSVTEGWSVDIPMLSALPLGVASDTNITGTNLNSTVASCTGANLTVGNSTLENATLTNTTSNGTLNNATLINTTSQNATCGIAANYSNSSYPYLPPHRALANRAGTGSASITVHGMHFGHSTYTEGARAGGSGCESTEWESASSVRCRMPTSLSGSRTVSLTVGERGGSVTEAWSLDIPTLRVILGRPPLLSAIDALAAAEAALSDAFDEQAASQAAFVTAEAAARADNTRQPYTLNTTRNILK